MRIGGENGTGTSQVGPLSPVGSSVASTSSTDEMIETENQSLRDRLVDLEKKVHDQNDEIVCLRSTLADALRRINNIEGHNRSNNSYAGGGRATPTKDGVRLRYNNNSDITRDPSKRATSYIPGRIGTPNHVNRRATHYQSTSSLYSDGQSSSSASPAPSPSPTHPNRYVTGPSPSTTGTPTTPTRPQQLGGLSKRWVSTSDFSSPGNPNSPGHNVAFGRRLNSGSLHNLNANLRSSNSQLNLMRQGREAQYNSEDGIVKMYLRGRPINLHVPTSLKDEYTPQNESNPPAAKLKLEWVYGYRGRDCRNNIYQLPTGEIVYFVAAVVVLYNVEERMQRHYLGHTDDIKCLAVHPNEMIIATGQAAGHDRRDSRPHIRIWHTVSLQTLHIIGIGDIEKSVACMAFSRDDGGAMLVCVDDAPDHNMSVWHWARGERGYKLMETKCSADQVLSVDFSPLERNTIIASGKGHIAFWVYNNGMLAKRLGIFENRERPKYVTTVSFTDTGNVISGDSNGNILIWQRGGNTVVKSIRRAHDGPIFSIFVQKDGTIISGGKDGKIIEWERDLERKINQINLSEQYGAPRVITNGRGSQLIIGTTRNCILSGTFSLPLQAIMQGHTEELWALSPHPSQNQFLTAGYDGFIYLWDTLSKSIIWNHNIGEHVQSAAFSYDGDIIIIGLTNGRWIVMDSETREIYSNHQDGSEPIQVVKFSPNGQYLALGSRDNNIYVYQVSDEGKKYSRVGRCQGHSSLITHLDWSNDSLFMQSNSSDYELLFWNAGLCRQIIQTSQMKNTEWAEQSCTVSFATIGIWQDGLDGSDINSCCKANEHKVIATGDDCGKIRLFNSPACYQKAKFMEATGHSSHVTSVKFLHDDSRLISIGGRDSAVIQWQISFHSTLNSR